jgi:transposase InsO family protein
MPCSSSITRILATLLPRRKMDILAGMIYSMETLWGNWRTSQGGIAERLSPTGSLACAPWLPGGSREYNMLQRKFDATHPNQKWAGDITVVATREGGGCIWPCCSICILAGVVAWAMGARITTELTQRHSR